MINIKSIIRFTEISWTESLEKFISEIERESNSKTRYEIEDEGNILNLSLDFENKDSDYHHFIYKGDSVIIVNLNDGCPFMISKTGGHIINEFKFILDNSRLGIFLLNKNDRIINLDIRQENGSSKT